MLLDDVEDAAPCKLSRNHCMQLAFVCIVIRKYMVQQLSSPVVKFVTGIRQVQSLDI